MRLKMLGCLFCFNTQPPEGGWDDSVSCLFVELVSTHSRLKAAGRRRFPIRLIRFGFNTQPPEGGWFGLLANGG